jgi:hypothetical protein
MFCNDMNLHTTGCTKQHMFTASGYPLSVAKVWFIFSIWELLIIPPGWWMLFAKMTYKGLQCKLEICSICHLMSASLFLSLIIVSAKFCSHQSYCSWHFFWDCLMCARLCSIFQCSQIGWNSVVVFDFLGIMVSISMTVLLMVNVSKICWFTRIIILNKNHCHVIERSRYDPKKLQAYSLVSKFIFGEAPVRFGECIIVAGSRPICRCAKMIWQNWVMACKSTFTVLRYK